LDGDNDVDGNDIAAFVEQYEANDCTGGCSADYNGNGIMDEPDLAEFAEELGRVDCIGIVTSTTDQVWMDRNLGASRVATSSTDSAAYGDLYQWGRGTDGHEKRTSSTTSAISSSDDPGHGFFITTSSYPYDWRVPQNNNLWQGVAGSNNPCPAGFRLPTATELDAERISWSSNDSAGAFNSPLKLTMAGWRDHDSGSIYDVGSYGFYWSSTVDGGDVRYLSFDSGDAGMYSDYRAYGFCVRCLED